MNKLNSLTHFKLCAVLIVFSILTACVSIPPTPAFDFPKGTKVGYVIEIDETIGHTHVGTTVFNNFERVKENATWNLTDFAKSEAQRLLKLHGFTAVELAPFTAPIIKQLESSLTDKEKGFKLSKEQELILAEQSKEYYGGLVKDDGIMAILSFRSSSLFPAYSECGAYGCTDFYVNYPGFFSRSVILIPPQLHAVLPSISNVFLTSEMESVQTNKVPGYELYPSLSYMKGFKPANFKSLSDEEWLQVEKQVKKLITNRITLEVRALKAGSDGQGGFLREPKMVN